MRPNHFKSDGKSEKLQNCLAVRTSSLPPAAMEAKSQWTRSLVLKMPKIQENRFRTDGFFQFLGAGLPFKESFEINCDEIFPEMQIAFQPVKGLWPWGLEVWGFFSALADVTKCLKKGSTEPRFHGKNQKNCKNSVNCNCKSTDSAGFPNFSALYPAQVLL